MIKYNTAVPSVRFNNNGILLCCILSFQLFGTLAGTNCKLSEDGVKTPKCVGVILTLILLMWRVG
jgi:hypothetical protein